MRYRHERASGVSISGNLTISDFFEPGTVYEADYEYIGAACGGNLQSVRSAIAEATIEGTLSFDIDLALFGTPPAQNCQNAF